MIFSPDVIYLSIFLICFQVAQYEIICLESSLYLSFLESLVTNMLFTFSLLSHLNCLISQAWMNRITIDFIWSPKFIWRMLITISFSRNWVWSFMECRHESHGTIWVLFAIPTHSQNGKMSDGNLNSSFQV